MQVIVAGLSKTGTKSMVVALQELGMNVYDFMEHFEFLEKDWINIYSGKKDIQHLREMYEDVDAAVDLPVFYFWEELYQAFPEAKIVLTVRDNEHVWYESMIRQALTLYSPMTRILNICSPTFRRFWRYNHLFGTAAYKQTTVGRLTYGPFNEQASKRVYKGHNAYVMKAAPKDKLLVYNVKEGWEPLCKFLGVDVPSKPFPHRNVHGAIMREYFETHHIFIRMQREMMVSFGLASVGLLFGCYKLVRSWPLCWSFLYENTVKSLLS